MKKRVNFYLDEELVKQYEEAKKKTHVPFSQMVTEGLRLYFLKLKLEARSGT